MRKEAELYNADYYEANKYGTDSRRAAAYNQERQRILQRTRKGTGYILDWGCGCGDFLNTFDDRWQKYGVEISPWARERAIEKDIDTVSPAGVYDFTPGVFDVVVFRGSLQHINHPFKALEWATRLLADDGLLAIIAQPNADSLCYRLFGDLPALDPRRNWWIPGARELVNVLYNLGLRVESPIYPYIGSPYANPRQDYVRFIGRLLRLNRNIPPFPGNMMEVYARL